MPTFRITVINEKFSATDDHELASRDEAHRHGVKGALAIGADEIWNGKRFFGAEVKIEEGGEVVGRFVVSIGSSPLQ